MSVNDPDGEPFPELTREEFLVLLLESGWTRRAAERDWERRDKPVYLCDLEW